MAFDDSKKNKGPLLKSYNVGGTVTIAGEWIAKAGTVQEEQKVPLSFTLTNGAIPPGPGGPIVKPGPILLDQTLVQTLTDERKRTSLTLNAPTDISGPAPPGGGPPGSWILVSEERIPNGQVATRTKSIVPEGSHLLLDDTMLTAEQRNMGLALEQVVLQAPLPGPGIVDARFDELGSTLVSVVKTRKQTSAIALGEKLVAQVPHGGASGGGLVPVTQIFWQKVTKEGETATVATEVNTSEPLPGTSVISYRLDPDGTLVTITRTLKDITKITRGEFLNAGHSAWTKVNAESMSALVGTEVVELRILPTVAVTSTKLEPDGTTSVSYKRQRAAVDIVASEVMTGVYDNGHPPNLIGYNWVKVSREGETGLVATEVTEVRFISIGPHDNVVTTGTVGPDGLKVAADMKLKRTQDALQDVSITDPVSQVGFIASHELKEVGALASEETYTTKEWLDKQVWTVSREVPLPSEYRGLLITTQEDHIQRGDDPLPYGGSGNRAALPTLGSGEIERTEQQIDNLLKRTSVKRVSSGTLPVIQTAEELTEEYGGLVLDNTKTLDIIGASSLDISNTEATDITVISDKVTAYGAFGIRERRTKKTAEAYHILNGTSIDETINFPVPFTQQVVPAGTVGGTTNGTSTEIRPIDAARSLKIVKSLPTNPLLTDFFFVFASTTNVQFPPELLSVKYTGTTAAGAGSYGNDGGYTIYNGGSGSMRLEGRANGSATAMVDVVPQIRQRSGANLQCEHVLFFMLGPVVNYVDVMGRASQISGYTLSKWPTWRPEAVRVVCKGQSFRASSTIDKFFSDTFSFDGTGAVVRSGAANSQGRGNSFDVEITSRVVDIPPTIHGALTIASDGSGTSAGYSAAGYININNNVWTTTPYPLTGTAVASLSTTSITATGGSHSVIPTGGTFISNMRVEPYKFGYFKCDVEFIDSGWW